MSPLANERFGEIGPVRTNDKTQRDYQEFLRRWSPELNRELSDAEMAQRRVVGTMPPPKSDYAEMIEREKATRAREEAARKAAQDAARRREIAERQRVFLEQERLEDELSADLNERIGL